MRNVRGKDTVPEKTVRSMIHRMGYRYRLHAKYLPGKPDMVFPGRKKVIFVHGCFWHLHEGCRKASLPKSNTRFWIPKLRLNRERDHNILQELKLLGWKVLVVWQCQISNTAVLSRRIKRFLG
jgi:DNA mismatch endonuclease (patch repair protein)